MTFFWCHKKGHISRECKEPSRTERSSNSDPKVCWRCGKKGHVRRDCRVRLDESRKKGSASNGPGNDVWHRRPSTPSVTQQPTAKNCFMNKRDKIDKRTIRVVPEVRNVAEELVSIGQLDNAEGKVLIDTGAQASLVKRDASLAPMAKPEVILKGISGRLPKTYGQQELKLLLKPGVELPGTFIVSNLPRGYLAVIGCDILKQGKR